jgi:hypothetical protein
LARNRAAPDTNANATYCAQPHSGWLKQFKPVPSIDLPWFQLERRSGRIADVQDGGPEPSIASGASDPLSNLSVFIPNLDAALEVRRKIPGFFLFSRYAVVLGMAEVVTLRAR